MVTTKEDKILVTVEEVIVQENKTRSEMCKLCWKRKAYICHYDENECRKYWKPE